MKQMILVLVILLLLLCLTACGTQKETVPSNEISAAATAEGNPTLPTDSEIEETVNMPQVTNPIVPKVYPEIPELWKINCEDYVLLRQEPDGTGGITWIAPDEKLQLLGWNGLYAYVSYEGRKGYVMSNLIAPDSPEWIANCLNTVEVTDEYSYEQMLSDMERLSRKYRDDVILDTIGYSESGLSIPVMVLGNTKATRHVLLQGAMHGREHMTAWLLMAMADCWLEQGLFSEDDNVCFHIIPMSNPDGVKISQSGTLNEEQTVIYQSDSLKGYTHQNITDYASQWKANALGIDINRNFPSGWYRSMMRQEPSSQRYGGETPFTAAEAIALRDYTQKYPFDITISYHSSGCVIYYEFGNQELANRASKELALTVNEITGYDLEGSGGVDGAGYKDWAIDVMQIPSLTIEIGCKDSPLDENEIYSIFARNLYVFPTLMERLMP